MLNSPHKKRAGKRHENDRATRHETVRVTRHDLRTQFVKLPAKMIVSEDYG